MISATEQSANRATQARNRRTATETVLFYQHNAEPESSCSNRRGQASSASTNNAKVGLSDNWNLESGNSKLCGCPEQILTSRR
jgi:hypothetical protein